MGDDILPADPAGDADDIRANTVGFLAAAQMGRRVGEVAHEVSDGTLLRGDALLRGLLRIAPVRHRAVHPGGEPDGDNGKRADDGRLPAKQLLFCRLSDGGEHRGPEMPEPRARPGSVDDSGGRHGLLDPKLRRGSGAAGQDDGYGSHGDDDEITNKHAKRMNAQKKIERWCRDERFMHYTARRMNEEIADVPENWTYDPEFEELDEAFETDDRYAVPLATYLLYRLRVARLHRNVRRRSRAVWRVFIQVAMLGQYVQVFDAFDPLLTELQQEVMILLHGEYVKKSNAKGNKAWSSRI